MFKPNRKNRGEIVSWLRKDSGEEKKPNWTRLAAI